MKLIFILVPELIWKDKQHIILKIAALTSFAVKIGIADPAVARYRSQIPRHPTAINRSSRTTSPKRRGQCPGIDKAGNKHCS